MFIMPSDVNIASVRPDQPARYTSRYFQIKSLRLCANTVRQTEFRFAFGNESFLNDKNVLATSIANWRLSWHLKFAPNRSAYDWC